MLTGYHLSKKMEEASAAYRVCEMLRARLNEEYSKGVMMEELFYKLIGFYNATAPSMTRVVKGFDDEQKVKHVTDVLANSILIYLRHDEWIDWAKVREYFAANWPELDVQAVIKPPSVELPLYTFVDGKSIPLNEAAKILLEKAGPEVADGPKFNRVDIGRAHPDQTIDIDLSKPIAASYLEMNEDEVLEKTDGKPLYPKATTPQEREAIRKLAEIPEEIKVALYRYWSAISSRDVPIFFMWKSYPIFAVWAAGNGYQLGYRLKREDKETGYVPSNVKWVPVEEMRK